MTVELPKYFLLFVSSEESASDIQISPQIEIMYTFNLNLIPMTKLCRVASRLASLFLQNSLKFQCNQDLWIEVDCGLKADCETRFCC